VNRSVGKAIVNKPKTRASRPAGPVIPRLAKILHECRASMHNPATGVMFHNGNGECSDMDQLVQLDGMQATLDVLGNGPAVPAYEVKGKVLNC